MSNRIELYEKIKVALNTGDVDEIANIFQSNNCKLDSRGLEIHDLTIRDIDFFDMFKGLLHILGGPFI